MRVSAFACTVLLLTAILGCGKSESGGPIVVGREAVSRETVGSFAVAIEQGSTLPWLSSELGTPLREASALLIRYHWLIGEAADLGVPVDAATATRALRERGISYPGGESSYEAGLRETGETQAIARLAVAAEIAASRLRQKALKAIPSPQDGAVESYYRHHLARYRVPEERVYDFAERIDGPQEIAGAERAIATNRDVKQPTAPFEAEMNVSMFRGEASESRDRDEKATVEEIFSTRPGILVGPFKFRGHEALFKITRIIRAYVKPLSQVRAGIEALLLRRATARRAARFVADWRAKWTRRTTCAVRYLVPGCRGYRGPEVVEEHPLSPE